MVQFDKPDCPILSRPTANKMERIKNGRPSIFDFVLIKASSDKSDGSDLAPRDRAHSPKRL
jgi:hypothetical protein